MSEGQVLRRIALAMFVGAVICAVFFVASGLALGWMLGAAALIMGAFMAVAVSFAA